MRADLADFLPIVCPVCRRPSAGGVDVYTLMLERVFSSAEDGEVVDGILKCRNPSCLQRFPVIDGIPIVVADLATYLANNETSWVVERDMAPELEALLAGAGPDSAPMARLLEQLSIYLDAHWGDRAIPPPDGPAPWTAGGSWPGSVLPPTAARSFGMQLIAERLQRRGTSVVDRAVELGASVGRGLAEIARGARFALGIDIDFASLRRARRLLRGEPLSYARRTIGRHYQIAKVDAGELAARHAAFICGDALDPPLLPESFDRVVALNILDATRTPLGLLSVIDGLCRSSGEIIIASPFSWQTGTVDENARLGEDDPVATLTRHLCEGIGLRAHYALDEQTDLAWWLRRDCRNGATYSTHYLRAHKLTAA